MTTYDEFRAQLETDDRRTRRKELAVKVGTFALLFAFGLPGEPWSPEHRGSTLAIATGTIVSQVLFHVGALDRWAARWIMGDHPRLRTMVVLLLLAAIVLGSALAYELACYWLDA